MRMTRVPVLMLIALLAACGGPAGLAGTARSEGVDEPARGTGAARPAAASEAVPDPVSPTDVESPHVEALADGLNAAGATIMLAAAADEPGDLVVSPLSIGLAFGMADVGAGDTAGGALDQLFRYPVDEQARLAAFAALLASIEPAGDDGPVLSIANRQFPDVGFEPREPFTDALATWFGAAIQPLPLQTDPDGSREVINGYVAEQTRDLIPDLLPEGFLTPQSVLVLVNALYLQADWLTPFGKYPTEETTFTRLDGTTTSVAMMDDQELFGPALDGSGFVAASKPYEGDELSLLVVVPDEGRFEDVRDQLADDLLDMVVDGATEQSVRLQLPRFTHAATVDLKAVLEGDLGIEGIFSADYPGIAEGIELSDAVHAADVATDEQGTVAAAATALGFLESGPGEPDLVVRADRPFLYAIRHQPTGAFLFLGQVLDPQDPGPAQQG